MDASFQPSSGASYGEPDAAVKAAGGNSPAVVVYRLFYHRAALTYIIPEKTTG